MTESRIDKAEKQDIPAIIELLQELFSIEKDFSPHADKQRKGLHLLLENKNSAVIIVARDRHDIVIGMVSCQLVISTAQGAPSAWIEDMVVKEGHRSQGTGRALLDAALAWAKKKGATRAQLLVDMENEPALGYYKHLGWENTQLQARRIFLTP